MAASRNEDGIWKEFTRQDCVSTMSIFEQAEKEGTALVKLKEKRYNETISRVSAYRVYLWKAGKYELQDCREFKIYLKKGI